MKRITETKCTCKACDNIWFYGKRDNVDQAATSLTNFGSEMENLGKNLMCCSGCFPAAFIPDKKTRPIIDLNRCQKCGSKAVKTERVTHEV